MLHIFKLKLEMQATIVINECNEKSYLFENAVYA